MKQMILKAAVIGVIAMTATGASALTLKPGEVLTTGTDGTQQVVGAGETESAQRNLENKGYHVSGGMLFIKVDEVTVAIDLDDLRGLNQQQQRDLLRVEIGKELGVDYVVGDVTEQDVIDGLLDETIGSDTVIFDATDAAIEAYEEKLQEALQEEHDKNGGDPNHVVCVGDPSECGAS